MQTIIYSEKHVRLKTIKVNLRRKRERIVWNLDFRSS